MKKQHPSKPRITLSQGTHLAYGKTGKLCYLKKKVTGSQHQSTTEGHDYIREAIMTLFPLLWEGGEPSFAGHHQRQVQEGCHFLLYPLAQTWFSWHHSTEFSSEAIRLLSYLTITARQAGLAWSRLTTDEARESALKRWGFIPILREGQTIPKQPGKDPSQRA